LQERKDAIHGVYSVIGQLSRTHHHTLECLIFHLVRIALQEETNGMSASALAIVFAPCILRCPDTTDPLQSARDASKTISCVELVIVEQMNKDRAHFKDISSLEFTENQAKSRLSLIHRSMVAGAKRRLQQGTHLSSPWPDRYNPLCRNALEEVARSSEETLEGMNDADHGNGLPADKEPADREKKFWKSGEGGGVVLFHLREELTFEMLALEPRAPDDETLEPEASIGTADTSENLNFESESAVCDRSGEQMLSLSSLRPLKAESTTNRSRRHLRKQRDALDSVDASVAFPSLSPSSCSCLPHVTRKRFQICFKSPFSRATPSGGATLLERPPGHLKGPDDRPQFTAGGTFNPEKGQQKLKNVKNSPLKAKEPPEGAAGPGRKRHPDAAGGGSPQQLGLLGSNESMVRACQRQLNENISPAVFPL
ncbi:LOW QUALITY PROTEIN: unconventional myosin-IXa-like, partial [Sphaerodactylus townsendi]|uniref:LOW QUALITY PROTEIN: unconventional myosin-IXa-like n=1 Tax=Sphaerodactylus townsendi TaxID=933632 RepID=UPI002026ADB8